MNKVSAPLVPVTSKYAVYVWNGEYLNFTAATLLQVIAVSASQFANDVRNNLVFRNPNHHTFEQLDYSVEIESMPSHPVIDTGLTDCFRAMLTEVQTQLEETFEIRPAFFDMLHHTVMELPALYHEYRAMASTHMDEGSHEMFVCLTLTNEEQSEGNEDRLKVTLDLKDKYSETIEEGEPDDVVMTSICMVDGYLTLKSQ